MRFKPGDWIIDTATDTRAEVIKVIVTSKPNQPIYQIRFKTSCGEPVIMEHTLSAQEIHLDHGHVAKEQFNADLQELLK